MALQKAIVYARFLVILLRSIITTLLVRIRGGWAKLGLTSKLQGNFQFITLREITKVATLQEIKILSPGTRDVYFDVCKARKQTPLVVPLKNGAVALWTGAEVPKNSSSKVVLLLHGGGYAIPAHPGHWVYMQSLMDQDAQNCSGVLLEYELSGVQPYPRQLIQAVTILDYLLEIGWKPNQIILTGESAGGNLILGLLLHLLRPCPLVPRLSKPLTSPLLGAIILSPWVTFAQETASFAKYQGIDMINSRILRDFEASFFRGVNVKRENLGWAEFAEAPESSWDRLNKVVSKAIIIGGSEEIFIDDIVKFGSMLARRQNHNVKLVVDKGIHAEPVLNFGEAVEDIPQWASALDWSKENILTGA